MIGRPTLAEVQCSRLKFEPGDRIIVRVYQPIDRDQKKKIHKTVQNWAGTDVEVLVIDAMKMDVLIDKCRTTK